jgi:flagellar hook-length control protein FliK
MEQIRLDPHPPFYTKRELRPTTAPGDIFATLLDVKLKDGGDLRPANDTDPAAARPEIPGRSHRAAPSVAKRSHQPTHVDRPLEARDALRLKAMQVAEAKAAERAQSEIEDRRIHQAKSAPDGDSLGCSGVGAARAEIGASGGDIDPPQDQATADGQGHGESSSGETGNFQPDTELSEPATLDTTAVPVSATLSPADRADFGGDSTVAAVPPPAAVSPDEAKAMAQAALAAAATALPEGVFDASAAPAADGTEPASSSKSIANAGTGPGLTVVNDEVAPEGLPDLGQGEAPGIGSTVPPQSDAAGVVFRPPSAASKAKTQAAGQGATAPHVQTHQPDQGPTPRMATGSTDGEAGAPAADDRGTTAGIGLAGEFEDADQNGLAGWSLHLAQGTNGRRADFIANLRQHLQNLPAHEQVAVHIQRAVTDRLSKLTVELSPVELGRIQVKLKIDEENRVSATVTVERAGTLELLQKDARALERALQEAGLKTDSSSLSFTLQGGETGDLGQNGAFGGPGRAAQTGDGAAAIAENGHLARPSVIETADGLVDVEV